MNHAKTLVAVFIALSQVVSRAAHAQCDSCHQILYTPSSGLPSATCFPTIGGPASASIAGDTLVLSSTSTAFSYDAQGVFPFRWSDWRKLQFQVRVPQGSYAYSPGPGFRAAAMVVVHDSDNYTYGVAVWPGGAAFTNHWNFTPVSGGFATVALDASQDFHTFTVVANANGAQFIIDGAPVTWLPVGATSTFNAPFFDFGIDSRYSGPTVSEWKYVQLSLVNACPGDLNCDRVVDDADFSIFSAAYEVLSCTDPAMPITCPADLNNDGLVDDSDYEIFIVFYELIDCPESGG